MGRMCPSSRSALETRCRFIERRRWWLVFFLLCYACPSNLAECSPLYHKNVGTNGMSKLRGARGRLNSTPTRRRLGGDKKNKDKKQDKIKKEKQKKKTEIPPSISPTPFAPTKTPTSPPASSSPTIPPSDQLLDVPSLSPSPFDGGSIAPVNAPTLPPTSLPTTLPSFQPMDVPSLSPTFFDSGTILLQFSLKRPTPLYAKDVLSAKEPLLTHAILEALLNILCVETDFHVTPSAEEKAINYCKVFRRLADDHESRSILLSKAAFQVKDSSFGRLAWTEWTIAYLITQVGEIYHQMAGTTLGNNATNEEIHDKAVAFMGQTAQLALANSIRTKSFDALIGYEVETSLVGQELTVFSIDEAEERATSESGAGTFHTLQAVGIVMFVVITSVSCLLVKLAAIHKQRIRRVENETSTQGGLHSVEELEAMLRVSRQSSNLRRFTGVPRAKVQHKVKQPSPARRSYATPPQSLVSDGCSDVISPLTVFSITDYDASIDSINQQQPFDQVSTEKASPESSEGNNLSHTMASCSGFEPKSPSTEIKKPIADALELMQEIYSKQMSLESEPTMEGAIEIVDLYVVAVEQFEKVDDATYDPVTDMNNFLASPLVADIVDGKYEEQGECRPSSSVPVVACALSCGANLSREEAPNSIENNVEPSHKSSSDSAEKIERTTSDTTAERSDGLVEMPDAKCVSTTSSLDGPPDDNCDNESEQSIRKQESIAMNILPEQSTTASGSLFSGIFPPRRPSLTSYSILDGDSGEESIHSDSQPPEPADQDNYNEFCGELVPKYQESVTPVQLVVSHDSVEQNSETTNVALSPDVLEEKTFSTLDKICPEDRDTAKPISLMAIGNSSEVENVNDIVNPSRGTVTLNKDVYKESGDGVDCIQPVPMCNDGKGKKQDPSLTLSPVALQSKSLVIKDEEGRPWKGAMNFIRAASKRSDDAKEQRTKYDESVSLERTRNDHPDASMAKSYDLDTGTVQTNEPRAPLPPVPFSKALFDQEMFPGSRGSVKLIPSMSKCHEHIGNVNSNETPSPGLLSPVPFSKVLFDQEVFQESGEAVNYIPSVAKNLGKQVESTSPLTQLALEEGQLNTTANDTASRVCQHKSSKYSGEDASPEYRYIASPANLKTDETPPPILLSTEPLSKMVFDQEVFPESEEAADPIPSLGETWNPITTKRPAIRGLQLMQEIYAKEKALEEAPTVERVKEIVDLYVLAGEHFEKAGIMVYDPLTDMSEFLADPLTTSILDGSYQQKKVSKKLYSGAAAIALGEVLESSPGQLEGNDMTDDNTDDESLQSDFTAFQERMDRILHEAKEDLQKLNPLGKKNVQRYLGSDDGLSDGTRDTVVDLDAMLRSAGKELLDIVSSGSDE